MPIISVIIPIYNGEKTIRETIESVLNQTFKDFELIAVDDGSTDQTVEIINRIQDSRIKLFSYPNAGLSTSRNRGIAKASGEYISFIDADDLWTADKLESQLKALQENPQAAVAYSWTDCIDESGKFLRRGGYINVTDDVYERLLLIDFVEGGSNVLIRKHVFAEVGGFDESFNAVEDWDMWLRLASHYRFVTVPSRQIFYRQSVNSMSTNVLKMEVASLRIIEREFAKAPEWLKMLKPFTLGNRYKYLTFKAIEGIPERRQCLTAARFMWNCIRSDRTLLQKRIIWKVLLKIAIVVLLPKQQAKALLAEQKLSDMTALLVHIKTELPTEIKKVSVCQ